MKIGILHLSDIHIRSAADIVLQRASKISVAGQNVAPEADAYLVAVTGDIAFSGKSDQYELAEIFLKRIKDELIASGKPVHMFCIPGNHDLDFEREPDTRPALLQTIGEKLQSLDLQGETVKQLLSVQHHFFLFEGKMRGGVERPPGERLVCSESFSLANQAIRVTCFNTAWVSTDPECPAQLVFPTSHVPEVSQPTSLAISLFHHPFNWLAPDNARAFRYKIEATSDVVLTGHEHDSAVYAKQYLDSTTVQYVEGAALQSDAGSSAFNLVIIDTVSESYEAHVCEWDGECYAPTMLGTRSFVRNQLVSKSYFRNTSSFLESLSDLGLPILHPYKHDIKLDDVYIYPALIRKDRTKDYVSSKVFCPAKMLSSIVKQRRIL